MAASVRAEAQVDAPAALARLVGLELHADVAQRALVEMVQQARLRALLLRVGEGVEHQVEDLDHDACSLRCDESSVGGARIDVISAGKQFVSGLYTWRRWQRRA